MLISEIPPSADSQNLGAEAGGGVITSVATGATNSVLPEIDGDAAPKATIATVALSQVRILVFTGCGTIIIHIKS